MLEAARRLCAERKVLARRGKMFDCCRWYVVNVIRKKNVVQVQLIDTVNGTPTIKRVIDEGLLRSQTVDELINTLSLKGQQIGFDG
jgi:hypothetical protein